MSARARSPLHADRQLWLPRPGILDSRRHVVHHDAGSLAHTTSPSRAVLWRAGRPSGACRHPPGGYAGIVGEHRDAPRCDAPPPGSEHAHAAAPARVGRLSLGGTHVTASRARSDVVGEPAGGESHGTRGGCWESCLARIRPHLATRSNLFRARRPVPPLACPPCLVRYLISRPRRRSLLTAGHLRVRCHSTSCNVPDRGPVSDGPPREACPCPLSWPSRVAADVAACHS